MTTHLYRVRSNLIGGDDEIVRSTRPEEAARIYFAVVEERGRSAKYARVVRLEPPEKGCCGHVYETTDETVIRWPDYPAAGKPFDYWPWECESQARSDGWILTNDGLDCTTISRIDNPTEAEPKLDYDAPKFTDDAAARTFVIERALASSKRHLLAIYLNGFPVEQPLDMVVPKVLKLCECLPDASRDGGRS
jgi:hypothetical protein